MKKTFRQVQFLSNIAVIVIAALLGFIVIKPYLFSSSETPNNAAPPRAANVVSPAPLRPAAQTPVGKSVPLQNIDWKENKKTLILYVSTTCRYCTESNPFYQRLVKENSSKNLKIVAVLTQPVEEAKEYLKKQNVVVEDVRSASFAPIGVTATPTLLVDENGVVSDYWRGRLQADKEAEVLSELSS